MEETKFRAWLTEDKQLRPVKSIFLDSKRANVQWTKNVSIIEPFDKIELMQFTGVKDKNGKEIYEGDIVKHKYMCDGIFYTEAVIYDKNYASFGLKANSGTIFYFVELNDDALSSLEVIGNIYENPELLGGK